MVLDTREVHRERGYGTHKEEVEEIIEKITNRIIEKDLV